MNGSGRLRTARPDRIAAVVSGDRAEESVDKRQALELLDRQIGAGCVVRRLVAGSALVHS
jgi:hypothetical protein